MKSSWYNKIKDLPKINGGKGRKDGYYPLKCGKIRL